MSKERGWVAKTPEKSKSDTSTPPAVDWRPNGIVAGGPRSSVALLRRFCALVIDWILCELVATALVGNLVHAPWATPSIFVLEYTFFIGLFTQTPGYWITRTRCVSAVAGGRIGLARSFVRAVLIVLLLPALLGWHNRAATSIVEPA